MPKHIFWDMDGTVVESEEVVFKTRMFAHASNKFDLIFDLRPDEFIGHEARNIFHLLLDKNGVVNKTKHLNNYDEWYEEAVRFIKSNISMVKPRDNVLDLWRLANKNGIKNAIVTSSREDIARAYLQNIGLADLCHHYTCINHVSKPKPSPIPYLRAMNCLQSNNKDSIVIEDSPSGIHSAKSANLYTIAWVKDKNSPTFAQADLVTDKLDYSIIEEGFRQAEVLSRSNSNI